MSKITVTTIAGLTSGGDANTVKIESGDAFNVVSGATTLGGTLGVTGVSTLTGNVGIGITPDTISNGKSIQINRSVINDDDGGSTHITQNGYYNSAWKYVENGTAEKISFVSGTIRFDNASSNSGGADASLSWSERMRISSAGELLVGTTTKETNGVTIYSNTANGFYVKTTSTCGYLVTQAGSGGAGTFMTLYSDTTAVGSITTNGSATAYNTSSDYRLKENVVTDWDATTRLKKLKPSRFNFKTDKDTTVDGFLAHEVSSIVPEAITGKKDAVDKDGNIEPQSIDQSKLVPLLVKTIQELEARISVLESK